jgi:hypothetical protein
MLFSNGAIPGSRLLSGAFADALGRMIPLPEMVAQ